jgi:hypothetical protein
MKGTFIPAVSHEKLKAVIARFAAWVALVKKIVNAANAVREHVARAAPSDAFR